MISAVVIAKNEEKIIGKCLESLAWCDEIVVVDDFSSDNTVAIAKSQGARVFRKRLNNNFAKQRNYGLKQAMGDWVLFVDADEIVPKALALEIKKSVTGNKYSGYLLRRTGAKDELLLRLAKKKAGQWERSVHETWKIKGFVGKLYSPLVHSSTLSLFQFIGKINYYSSLHAKENRREGKVSTLPKILFWPIFRFSYDFLVKRGYKLGTAGFVNATLMSFHSFIAWSKQWEVQEKK